MNLNALGEQVLEHLEQAFRIGDDVGQARSGTLGVEPDAPIFRLVRNMRWTDFAQVGEVATVRNRR